ncbi:hypothetical protein V6N12_020994 [Hibiscus sabdariffa]|uniref:Uncharacterized protein n=1 Tax=Hibiscus sabdariffa TaxID=183260 RepID=A0ABR2CZP7_9ROSI
MVKVQRLMKKSRGRTPNLMIPQGISPIIIPGSKEDHESTRESVNVLNGPDTSIRAGKGIDADLPISVTPQEGERTILSSISTKDKNVIEERMDADLANNEMVSAFDNFICNNLKKIRVKNKRKREENEWKVQSLPIFVCSCLELVLMQCFCVCFGFCPWFFRVALETWEFQFEAVYKPNAPFPVPEPKL